MAQRICTLSACHPVKSSIAAKVRPVFTRRVLRSNCESLLPTRYCFKAVRFLTGQARLPLTRCLDALDFLIDLAHESMVVGSLIKLSPQSRCMNHGCVERGCGLWCHRTVVSLKLMGHRGGG